MHSQEIQIKTNKNKTGAKNKNAAKKLSVLIDIEIERNTLVNISNLNPLG